jgi:ankyrin repeat protein
MEKLMKLLASKDGEKITTNKNHTGLTILAFAISHNPPLNVVETMLKVNPSLILQEDSNGHLPLHIACANGCNSQLIHALIQQDGNFAASIHASINQRCPLDYTCMYILNPLWHESSKMLSGGSIRSDEEPDLNGTYHKNNIIRRTKHHQEDISLKSKDSKSTIMTLKHEEFEDQLLVLQKLISIAPHVLNARDKYGYAPIDYFQDFLAENVDVSPRSERCDKVR